MQVQGRFVLTPREFAMHGCSDHERSVEEISFVWLNRQEN